MRILKSVLNISSVGLIAVSSLLVSLAGCGGGGGDSSSAGGGGGGVPAAVTITSDNAPTVAGAAFSTVFGGVGSTPIGVQTTAPNSTNLQLLERINSALIKQIAAQSSTPATVTGTGQTYNYNCYVSGSVSINNTGAASYTVTYSSCNDGYGVTVSGTASVSNFASSSTATSYEVSFDEVFDLTEVTAADSVTVSGDMHFDLVTDSSYNLSSMSMSGNSLSFTSAVSGTRVLTNYSLSADATNAVSMNFTFSSSVMGGSATFVTIKPFNGPGNYPNTGIATVSGANSTVLRITVLGDETAPSNSQVELEVSSDGGATYGTPSYVTWGSLNI